VTSANSAPASVLGATCGEWRSASDLLRLMEVWRRGVVERGYEGYVAKDEASEGGATRRWLKVKQKCRSATARRGRRAGAGATAMEEAVDSDFTWRGAVSRLVDSGGIEIDGKVVVVPQVLLGIFVRVGDHVEVTRVPQKSGRYINIVRAPWA
jgi:hypothetical protein